MTAPKSNLTTFKKGRKKTGGRKRGIRNKTSSLLREAVQLAAEAVGSDGAGKSGLTGYLTTVARNDPAVFCKLLAHAMPLKLETEQTSQTEIIYRSVAEIRQELIRSGVPQDIIYPEPLALTDETDKNTDEQ